MARFSQVVIDALAVLFDTGYVDFTDDRALAAEVFRAARDGSVGWDIDGGSHRGDDAGEVIYFITADPPLCDGGCGDRTTSPTGMCYQCQCKAHADGWYSMDDGHARCGRSDEEIHLQIEYLSR